MTDADYESLGVVIATAVNRAVTRATAPLESLIATLEMKLAAVESRAMVPGPAGEKGLDGRDGLDGMAGKDGAPGIDGKDGERGLVGEPGATGERGPRGESGADGVAGPTGPQGERGIDGKDGLPGEKGLDGAPGIAGRDGLPGVQGPKGMDGLDGARGEKGLDGKDGRDGIDGTLEHLVVEQIDERTIRFVGEHGRALSEPIALPIPIDKGVYRDGDVYRKADGVTFGGSFFIAQRDTVAGEKPEDGSKAWRLAVKRGRDGREGKQGQQGTVGPKGDAGAPGRNYQ